MKTSFEGKKLYAVIIAFLLIITFFITFHIIRNHYKYVFKKVITDNTLTANLLSSLMYEHQKAAISILESYAQRPLFIDAVKKKDFHRAFYHLKSLSEHHTENDALFITDKSGTLWANYPMDSKGFGKNLAYRDWYKGVSKKWRPYISSVYRLIVLEKGLAVAVSVPVFDRKGKVIGILSGAQRTAFLDTFVKDNIIDPEKNITLLDQEGNIIFSNAVPYQEKITKYPDAHVLEKALAGVFIDMEIADAKEKGSISYASIAPVRGIGWSVIVGQEKNAILKSLYRYFILSAVAGLVIFLFLTVSLLYFRREYRYRKTKELQESEERLRTIVEASMDAIMAVNAEGRLVLFNGAAQELFQYSEEEALNQPVDILLREEICKIHQERLERFLKRGVGQCGHIGRRMEKFFRRKDGSLFEAEVSMSGGRSEGLRLVILSIHDITERKRAEEALRESEARYRSLFENNHAVMLLIDPDNAAITDANPAACAYYGWSREELKKRRIDEINTLTSKEVSAEMQLALSEKRNQFFFKHRRADGTIRDVEVYSGPILLKGKFLLYSIVHDITERKQGEEALRESEDNFRRSMDESPLGICIMSEEKILYANRAILNFFGYESIEELREIPFTKRYMESIYAEFLDRRAKRRLHADDSSEYEIDIVRKDGEIRNLEVWRKRVLWNGNEHYQVIYRDITERKEAEEALRESEEYFREITENSSDIIIITDKNGDIKYCSRSIERFAGFKPDELIGRSGFTFIYPDDVKRAISDFGKAILEIDSAIPNAFRIVHKDGSERYFEGLGKNLLDNPVVAGFIMNIRDITERKRAEEELQANKAQLSNALEMAHLGHWEYDVANDLFTFNDHFYNIFRTTVEQVGGYTMHSAEYAHRFVHPDDMDVVGEETRKAIETTDPHFNRQIEHRMLYADGTVGYITVRFFIVKDSHGRTVKTYGVNQDITERKRAEEEKRRMEERSRKVVEDIFRFIPEGVLVFSRKMELLRQNQAFRELVSGYAKRLGFAEDELENLIIDKVKAGLRDNNIKEIKIARKHETREQT
ncbi:MAG: PAS domain S-box protein [Deltaproteobacteria bacterium]|nr:PAS domain S-box protein [Deltaproteobacteria bacterium]